MDIASIIWLIVLVLYIVGVFGWAGFTTAMGDAARERRDYKRGEVWDDRIWYGVIWLAFVVLAPLVLFGVGIGKIVGRYRV